MQSDNINNRVYTLSEITESITRMFDKFFEKPYWIKAEISALNLYPVSGHCFPLMVEKSDGKVKAQLKAIIWKDDLFYITRKFEEVTKETLHEGLDIMFLAHVKFSSTYGLSLQIIDIEPLYTLGEMARDKMNTILQLKKEGTFELNRSLPLPILLKRVAIISVASSKGYNDLIVTLENNKAGYKVITRLFPAVLQGKGAVETITTQLNAIRRVANWYDAVLIVRGGGDDVGLSCYDDLALAREVAGFPLPVITGIGHSTNETVVEMVARVNKITPTDVAHFVLSGFFEQDQILRTYSSVLLQSVEYIVEKVHIRQGQFIDRFHNSCADYFKLTKRGLSDLADDFSTLANRLIFNNKIALNKYEMGLSYHPVNIIRDKKTKLGNHVSRLLFNTQHYLTSHEQLLKQKDYRLRLLDPQNILRRGYSILRIDGKAVTSATEIKSGDHMDVESYNFTVAGIVEEIKEKKK